MLTSPAGASEFDTFHRNSSLSTGVAPPAAIRQTNSLALARLRLLARWTIAGMLLSALAMAQAPPPPEQPQDRRGNRRGAQSAAPPAELLTGTGTIGGLAMDSLTGQPLSKVRVVVMMRGNPRQRSTATTGADGMFLIENLPAGQFTVTADRSGYARAFAEGQRRPEGGARIDLAEGAHVKDLVLKLDPGAVLTGRISDQEGEPVEGLRVQALKAQYQQGRRELLPVGSDTTDDRGEFRIYGLASGRYYVQAMRPGMTGPRFFVRRGGPGADPPEQSGEPSYVSTYFPNASEASAAEAILVRPGQERSGLDIRLLMERTVDVKGTVAGLPPEISPRQVLLFLAPSRSSTVSFLDVSRATVDAQNQFRFRDVQPGSYWLVATTFSRDNRLSSMQRVEVGGADVENLDVALQPGTPVRGVVKVAQTTGVATAPPPIALTLEPVLRMQRMTRALTAAADAEGRFEFPEVPAGIYRIRWSGLQGNWYFSSVAAGQLDLLDQDWQVTPAAASTPLTLTLRPDGATVRAIVQQDSRPLKDALVSLVPAEETARTDRYFRAATDEFGGAQFTGVPPGDYRLYAWESSDGVLDADPDYLAQFEDRAVSVSLDAGSSSEKRLAVIPASETAAR